MTVFSTALATLHADTNLSIAARWRRPPYVWHDIRLILSQPADEFGRAVAGTLEAEVRESALGEAPQRLDEVEIDGTVHRVESATRDALALTWRLTLSSPS